MNKWRPWWLLAVLFLLIATPAAAQTPPITFEDPLPSTAVWPNPVEATVLNNTTQTLMVTIQMPDLRDTATGAVIPVADVLQPLAPSVTIPPAGEASLVFLVNEAYAPTPGELVGSLVLSVPSHNAVLRKPISLVVSPPSVKAVTLPALVPAVESWTLSAVRVFPFVRPLCLRGLLAGCTLPLERVAGAVEAPYTIGQLTNEAGGGIEVTLLGVDSTESARLLLDFDRRWGYVGTYAGTVNLVGQGEPTGQDLATTDVTVHVKDIVVWPLLVLWVGIAIARQAQYYITVRRRTLSLLEQLNKTGLEFAKLRKSVHGYTVADDFQSQRDELETRIRLWDRTHYGNSTEQELHQLEAEILAPLADLERQLQLWAQFREKLDRLGRRLLQNAKPAIQAAERPTDVDLEEPRFYTSARLLLRGTKLQMSQVPDYASRVDDAAELASKWGELEHLAVLVKNAIRELGQPDIELSESETEMLEAARHHLNSAARDLWEAQNLADLRTRETETELVAAQDLARRLLDPFVYYAGAEIATPREMEAEGAEPEAYPAQIMGKLAPMARVFALIDTFRLPRLDFNAYQRLSSDEERTTYVQRALVFGERTVTAVAVVTALLFGLERYFTSNFGTTADYLALFTSGLAAKAGLEIANAVLGRLLKPRE